MEKGQQNIHRVAASAVVKPIKGRCRAMAVLAREYLGWGTDQFVTSREACRTTGVNYTTINGILSGDRPKADTLVRFASGLGHNPRVILEAAGFSTRYLEGDGPTSRLHQAYDSASPQVRAAFDALVDAVLGKDGTDER